METTTVDKHKAHFWWKIKHSLLFLYKTDDTIDKLIFSFVSKFT